MTFPFPFLAPSLPSPLLAGLLAFYKLESNSNDSVGTNNGTDTAITYSAGSGKVGNGAVFDGSSSRIVLAPIPTLTTNFTVAMWVKPDVVSGARDLYNNGSQANFLRMGIVGTGIRVAEDNIADYPLGGALAAGNWYHIAFVKSSDAGSNVKAYINGIATGTTASVGTISTPSGTAYLGRYAIASSSYFDGSMDEVGMWNRALSAEEVALLYSLGNGGTSYPF